MQKLGQVVSSLFSYKGVLHLLQDYGVFFTHGILQVAPIHSLSAWCIYSPCFSNSTPTCIPVSKIFIFGFFNILFAATLSSYPISFVSFFYPFNDFSALRTFYYLWSLSASIFLFSSRITTCFGCPQNISTGIIFGPWGRWDTGLAGLALMSYRCYVALLWIKSWLPELSTPKTAAAHF